MGYGPCYASSRRHCIQHHPQSVSRDLVGQLPASASSLLCVRGPRSQKMSRAAQPSRHARPVASLPVRCRSCRSCRIRQCLWSGSYAVWCWHAPPHRTERRRFSRHGEPFRRHDGAPLRRRTKAAAYGMKPRSSSFCRSNMHLVQKGDQTASPQSQRLQIIT